MTTNVFAIISDGGKLLGGVTHETKVSALKANGFEQINHSEDFLNALADSEYAVFIPKNEQDIERLYDECNVFSLSYSKKEILLQAYAKAK